MNLMVEISLYPLQQDYIEPIKQFIERLNQDPRFTVETTATSTRVSGEHFSLMTFLADEMHNAYQQIGQAIFVCKFLNADKMGNNSASEVVK